MRQEITVEIGADRTSVWSALVRDLGARGAHVEIVRQHTPEDLTLRIRAGLGEEQILRYTLVELDELHTAVVASIEPSGPLHVLKRLFSFGAVDQHYINAVAVGLANLQRYVEGASEDAEA